MYNFERAAAVLRGENIADRKPPGYPFDDTDPYKVLEGASYSLAVQPDPKLRRVFGQAHRRSSPRRRNRTAIFTPRARLIRSIRTRGREPSAGSTNRT